MQGTRGARSSGQPASLPPLSAEAEQRFAEIGNVSNLDSDLVWVYHHLHNSTVNPMVAPSRGAWSLLTHARQDPARFYERLYLPVVKQLARQKSQAGGRPGNSLVPSREEQMAIADLRKMLKDAVAASQKRKV
jgi:hypothetical protein